MTPDRTQRWTWGLLLAWGFYATLFVFTKPIQTGSHDFSGHVQYTDILMHQHRYPAPLEGWETHQMPLYYRINSLLRLPMVAHVQTVRLLSVLYGLCFLGLLARALRRVTSDPAATALSLGFMATTPKFVFLFTSYNNDALLTLLAAWWVLEGWEFLQQPERRRGLILLLIGILGIYTKLTFVFAWGSLLAAAGLMWAMGNTSFTAIKRLGLISAGVLIVLLPWLYVHNHRATGQWIVASGIRPEAALRHSPLGTLLSPPRLAEWKDPYIHMPEAPKAGSFVSSVLASSVFGAATFPSIPVLLSWMILLGHAGFGLLVWGAVLKSPFTRFHGLLIVGAMGSLALFLVACPTHPSMDFRFIAWSWLPWGVLLAALVERSFRRWVGGVIAAQTLFLVIWLFHSGRGYY